LLNTATRPPLVPLLILGTLALTLGIWSYLQLAKPPAMLTVTVLPTPRALPEFEMTDKNDNTVGREVFADKWSLVFLGFTSCGHICPLKMVEMRTLQSEVGKPLQLVFISVDPGRDTAEVIKSYVEGFDQNFNGLTGSAEAIDAVASALGAPYYVDTNPDRYTVDHSSALFLIGPDAALAGVITAPLNIRDVAKDLNNLL
jgi:protein SCO1/2